MLRQGCQGLGAAIFVALLALCFSFSSSFAGSLRLQPISLEVLGPTNAATITLRNEGRETVTVQTRMFKWTQSGGNGDVTTPTREVVVSPPTLKLKPGAKYVLRIVRTDKKPIKGEEAYRLLVDELPNPARMRNGAVTLTIRQSVPVFFIAQQASVPKLVWSYRQVGNRLIVTAHNNGERFLRVVDLEVKNSSGVVLGRHKGLSGYVLGNSSRSWTLPLKGRVGGELSISASSNIGMIDAKARSKAD